MKIVVVKKAEVKNVSEGACPWVVEYMAATK